MEQAFTRLSKEDDMSELWLRRELTRTCWCFGGCAQLKWSRREKEANTGKRKASIGGHLHGKDSRPK